MTQEDLEQSKAEADKQISALRHRLDQAVRAAGRAKQEAAINAERPLPVPVQFVQ